MRTVAKCILAAGALAAGVATAGELCLAERGRPAEGSICVSPVAGESERYAAAELQGYVKRMTGVELPISTNAAAGAGVVIALDAEKGDDTFNLKADGGRLRISGGKRGVLYGVYEILERFGGVGWYASWCEVVPERNKFCVPADIDEAHSPALRSREAFWYDAYVWKRGDFAARLRLNGPSHRLEKRHGGTAFRFGGGLGSCHTFAKLIPPKEYFAAHPEWFAEVAGKRTASGQWQPCLTNPGARATITSNVIAAVRRDMSAQCYGVSQNDCYGFCECAGCKAVDDEEGSHSGTMIRFVNDVADEVGRSFPGKIIETLAYHYTQKPPRLVRPRDNVMPYLCSIACDFAQPIATGTHPENAAFRSDFLGWAAISRQLYVWDYGADFGNYLLPHPVETVLRDNMRFFAENRAMGVFEQGAYHGYHGDLSELKTYLAAKWAWNPGADADALVRRFTDGFYGAAAPHVREYLALRRELAGRPRDGDWKFGCWASASSPMFTDDFVRQSILLWRRAAKAVKGDAARMYNVRMGAMSSYCLKALRDGKKVNASREMSGLEAARAAACAAEVLAACDEARKAKRPIVFAEGGDARNRIRRKLECVAALGKNAPRTGVLAAPDRVVVEETALNLLHEGTMTAIVDDPAAGNGRAVRLDSRDNGGWHTTLPMADVAFDKGVKYRLRIRARAEKTGAGGKGFGSSVYDGTKKKGLRHSYFSLDDMADGYAWYDILDWTPEKTQSVWVAPGQFDSKAHKRNMGHDGIFIDCLELVRLP